MTGGCSGRQGTVVNSLYMYVRSFVGKKRRATDRLARDAAGAALVACGPFQANVPRKGAFDSDLQILIDVHSPVASP